MQIGDYVLAPLADWRVAVGRVRGEYRPRAQASDPRLRHTRRVDWLRTLGRAELPPELQERVHAPGPLSVVQWAEAAHSIEALLGDR